MGIGVSFGESIVIAEGEKTRGGWLLKNVGWVKRSEPNNVDLPVTTAPPRKDELHTSVRDLVKNFRLPKAGVSISIPDIFARTSILEFEELPFKTASIDEVVRWKAAKEALSKPEDLNIGYKVLWSHGLPAQAGEGKASLKKPKRILSVVVSKDIIEMYESIFKELGINVGRINIHSFNVFNLLTERRLERDFIVVMLWSGYFSVLAFKGGILDFYRCKEVEEDIGHTQDLLATFAFYKGKNPDCRPERLYLFGAAEAQIAAITDVPIEVVMPESLLKADDGLDAPGADSLQILSAIGAFV